MHPPQIIWILILLLSFRSQTEVLAQSNKTFEAEAGRLDLTGWSGDSRITLQGEWMFFPNVHLSPTMFWEKMQNEANAISMTQVGKSFRESKPSLYTTDFGMATYALILSNVPKQQLGLAGASVYTSGQVLIFSGADPNQFVYRAAIGRPGVNKDATEPRLATDEVLPFLTGTQQETVILIHVSNFHHSWGGLWIAPQLSLHHELVSHVHGLKNINYWLLGLLFFLSAYNISLYLRRPEDRSSLFLALFALVLAARTLVLAESSLSIFPDPVWAYEFTLKVIYISMVLSPCFFLYFLNSCFPERVQIRTVHILSGINAFPIFFVLLTPATIYGQYAEPVKAMGFLSAGAGSWILMRAWRAHDDGAVISLSGALFIFIGLILDMLNSYGFNNLPTNSTGIGMSVFIICQSQIVASRFAQAFRRSEHLSKELQNEVEKQTRDIKSILASIRQGIFTISRPDQSIDDLHSEFLKELTGESSMHGQSLRSLIFNRSNLTEDVKATTESTLDASLGEDVLNFEVNASNLVRELEYLPRGGEQKQIFELDWNPILKRDQTIEKILVSLRDVTTVRALQAQSQQQERDMRIIMDLIRIPEDRFQRFVAKTLEYLQENRELINQATESKTDVVKRLFVNMHTIKGAARTYYLQAISSASHDVEQYYAGLQKQTQAWDKERLLEDIQRVEAAVELYRHVGEHRLGWQSSNKAVKMSRKEIEYTLEMLTRLEHLNLTEQDRDSLLEAERVLLENCYTELPGVIDESFRGIDSMARDLGKAVPIVKLDSTHVVLKDKGADLLHGMMTHLLRNSLDHGIEKPEDRLRKGKPAQGTIHMWTQLSEPYLYIYFEDDGNGLNLVKLERIGRQRGLLPSSAAITDQQIAELIFHSGLSTKDEVSDISGRGVGMDAVKSYLEDHGGFIQVVLKSAEDREHVPFTLNMNFPLSLCFLAKLQPRPSYSEAI